MRMERSGSAYLVLERAAIVEWNPAAESVFGAPGRGLAGRMLAEFVADGPERETDLSKVQDALRRACEGQVSHLRMRLTPGSGAPFEAEMRFEPAPGREPERVRVTLRGMPDYLLAQRALQETESRLQMFLRHAPAAVAMLDQQMACRMASRQWASLFNMGTREILGDLPPAQQPPLPDSLRAICRLCLSEGRRQSKQEQVLLSDGSLKWIEWDIQPWRDAEGQVGGVVAFAEDVTERKWGEEALRQARDAAERTSRLKSQFLANVSHEVRTPLNAIIGFAEIIRDGVDADAAAGHAQVILRQAEELLRLVQDLLDHAKIEAGRMDLETRPFALEAMLEAVREAIWVQVRKKGISFELEVADDAPRHVKGDEFRLRQVLMNLVSNAVKFTEHGRILLRVTAEHANDTKATVRFTVQDTGIGIPADRQEAIFEGFTQVDATTTRRFGGTGLGVTISRRLVDIMGGRMGLESAPGRGSTFWFTVPFEVCRAEEVDAPQEDPTAASSLPGGRRILLVEDYAPNRDLARMHLESVGYEITVAENGLEALDACDRKEFDLILMDLQMPEMDGCEAARRIRSGSTACRDAPILALTAGADRASIDAACAAGMNDAITKPIRRVPFLKAVERFLRKAETRPRGFLGRVKDTASRSLVVFDGALALSEFGGNKALLKAALRQFTADLKSRIEGLRSLEDLSASAEEVARDAHRIRGGAASLTADALAAAAERLESAANSGILGSVEKALDDLESEFKRLTTRLDS